MEGGTLQNLVYSHLRVELDALMAIGFAKDVVSGMTHIHVSITNGDVSS